MKLDALVSTAPVPSSDWRGTLIRGYGLLTICVACVFSWAAFARIDGAVVAAGVISVQSNTKTIQHLEGGIVQEIAVRSGEVVAQGQVLLRLDPTRSEAGAELYRKQLAMAKALEARLLAQHGEREQIVFPADVVAFETDPTIRLAMSDNRRQFESRRNAWLSANDVIGTQMEQVQRDAESARATLLTAEQQLKSIGTELPPLQALFKRGLVPLPRITTLERQQQQLEGEAAKARIEIAREQEKLAEFNARREQLRQEYKQEAAMHLPEVRRSLNEIEQQLIVAKDALRRIDITAPVTGTVQNVQVFTIGGVVRPGDALLDIVPLSDTLIVRGRVSPIDIDRIRAGMAAELRLPQFQRYQSEAMFGEVTSVSRDTIPDPVDPNLRFYSLEVEVKRATVPEKIEKKLVAGMTVDVIIPTEERTVLEYIVAPVLNHLATSLRER